MYCLVKKTEIQRANMCENRRASAHFSRSLLFLLHFSFVVAFFVSADTLTAAELTVLHTNDVHAWLSGKDQNGQICLDSTGQSCQGGMAQFTDLIKERYKKPAQFARSAPAGSPLLLDAGDQFQGTPFYARGKHEKILKMMHAAAYTAMCPGNHEFDHSCADFAAFVRKAAFPVLAANVHPQPECPLTGLLRPWIIIEIEEADSPTATRPARQRIGIIGLTLPTLPEISSPCSAMSFEAPRLALQRSIQELHAQNVHTIIALTHLGVEQDRALARETEGLSLIVGGHSHSLFSNALKNARYPYPLIEHSPSGKPVLIVSSGSEARSFGALTLSIAPDAVHWSGDSQAIEKAGGAENSSSLALLREEMERISREYALPLTFYTANPVNPTNPGNPEHRTDALPEPLLCRRAQCPSGSLLSDSLLDYANSVEARTRWIGADAALMNGGAIRSALPEGQLTVLDVLRISPYQDNPVLRTLTGAELLALLEHGLSGLEQASGRFPQVAGISYSFDSTQPTGKRLLSARIQGQPVQLERRYRLVLSGYLAKGGDGYPCVGTDDAMPDVIIQDIFVRYLKRYERLTAPDAGRITDVAR